MDFHQLNHEYIRRLSIYLNKIPTFVTSDIIDELKTENGLSEKEAFCAVLGAGLALDPNKPDDEVLLRKYLPESVHMLDKSVYENNPYYRQIQLPSVKQNDWEFRQECYAPYEAFACDDFKYLPNGEVVPQIGFFREHFPYPAVLQDGREWMLITPNEINTMEPVIEESKGKVLTLGLGLGYFAFMCSRKEEVDMVTVVEKDRNIISLFREFILPQFPYPEKIKIVHSDAFDFVSSHLSPKKYNLVFTDLWHDPSDGVSLWNRMKKFEYKAPGTTFRYWISDTMRYYL